MDPPTLETTRRARLCGGPVVCFGTRSSARTARLAACGGCDKRPAGSTVSTTWPPAAGPTQRSHRTKIGILIAVVLAALVYFICVAVGLPAIVAIIAAILVLVSGIGTGGYGYGRRGI